MAPQVNIPALFPSLRDKTRRAKLVLIALASVLLPAASSPAGPPPIRYAVALSPTPVLNTPDFRGVFGGRDGRTLQTDACGLIRAVEFVARPRTVFRIEAVLEKPGHQIFRVTTDDYPYPATTGYFIDSRFVSLSTVEPPPRPRLLPGQKAIIDNLLSARGNRYVWGGNERGGVPELLRLYPPPPGAPLSRATTELWQLKGLDCSGLLYEATDGFTPRNTSALVSFGRGVPVANLSAAEIVRRAEPLDLVTWPGHVLIVIDRERVIESRPDCRGTGGGVMVRPLLEVIGEIMATRRPLDEFPPGDRGKTKGFVIRRWYPHP